MLDVPSVFSYSSNSDKIPIQWEIYHSDKDDYNNRFCVKLN
jgi:hypothetical protein